MIDLSPLIRSGEAFTTGASKYFDAHPRQSEGQPRVYVKFRPEGLEGWHLGLLDTGAHFCILNHSVARLIEDRLTESLGSTLLQTARGPLRGDLHILGITLVAESGEDLQVDAVVFTAPDWDGPSFIGYSGMLDRMSFALDPQINVFYFGRLT